MDEEIPRQLREKTGRHRCTNCLADVPAREFLANDFLCAKCAETLDEYPLKSTPSNPPPDPKR